MTEDDELDQEIVDGKYAFGIVDPTSDAFTQTGLGRLVCYGLPSPESADEKLEEDWFLDHDEYIIVKYWVEGRTITKSERVGRELETIPEIKHPDDL